jgi:hypothetical protein
LFPQIMMEMSSRGSVWGGMLVYPVVMARWTAVFVVVSRTQFSC